MAGRGKGIEIPIVADTKDFVRNTKQAEGTLEDFGDSLDQVARDGAQAADKLERSLEQVQFDQVAREAERAADKIDVSFRDAARAVNRSTDKIKTEAGQSFRDVGAEAGAEFSQNFGEAIRSGNPADAIVETVTSLSGALGGIGLVLAGAFGIGAAIVKEIQGNTEAVRTAATGLFNAARQGAIDAAAKEDFVNAILGTESWADSLRLLAPLARQAGVPIGDVVAEIESGGDASTKLDTALDGVNKRLAEAKTQADRQTLVANLDAASVAAGTLAGFYRQGADAIAIQNELLAAQRDIALNTIRQVERAGTAARGVTGFERSEMRARP